MKETFEDFVHRALPGLHAFGYRLSASPHDGADLAQEVLARAGARWWSIRSDDPLGYVHTTMARLHIDARRRVGREYPGLGEVDVPRDLADLDEALDVRAALRLLPPGQRAVLVLRYYLDYPEQRIAETLQCSPGTVKSQAHDGLKQLGRLLTTPLAPHQQQLRRSQQ